MCEQVTSADDRVLRHLADLAELYGGTVPLPQEALDELAGTSRAMVNRVFREQQARATVELSRSKTIVLDRERLRRRSWV